MKYTLLEFIEDWGYGTDIDVDFQKLYDFIKSENYSGVPLETDLDVIEEFENCEYDYIEDCFDILISVPCRMRGCNDEVLDKITKDFTEWIKNKNQ